MKLIEKSNDAGLVSAQCELFEEGQCPTVSDYEDVLDSVKKREKRAILVSVCNFVAIMTFACIATFYFDDYAFIIGAVTTVIVTTLFILPYNKTLKDDRVIIIREKNNAEGERRKQESNDIDYCSKESDYEQILVSIEKRERRVTVAYICNVFAMGLYACSMVILLYGDSIMVIPLALALHTIFVAVPSIKLLKNYEAIVKLTENAKKVCRVSAVRAQ